jgi:hypothetical protein
MYHFYCCYKLCGHVPVSLLITWHEEDADCALPDRRTAAHLHTGILLVNKLGFTQPDVTAHVTTTGTIYCISEDERILLLT